MAEFNTVTCNHLTITECDEIAKVGGRIASFGFSYNCPKGGIINEEYEGVVVNTQGMGNHGSLVLRGRTLRAACLLREGKIKLLTDNGVRRKTAIVAVSMHRGMEKGVALLADQLVELCILSNFNGHSRAQFTEWSGGIETNLSFPRILSAISIAEKV